MPSFSHVIGVSIFVLVERIKEIRSGEEDDLGNTDYILDKKLEMSACQARHSIENIGRDITQAFKTLVGGELKAYTEMMNDAGNRDQAHGRGRKARRRRGRQYQIRLVRGDAGRAEVIVYGTAVNLYKLLVFNKSMTFLGFRLLLIYRIK